MTTSHSLLSAAEQTRQRQARYNSRKRVNQIALTLALAKQLADAGYHVEYLAGQPYWVMYEKP